MAGSGEAKKNNTEKTEKPPKICGKNTIPVRAKELSSIELCMCFLN